MGLVDLDVLVGNACKTYEFKVASCIVGDMVVQDCSILVGSTRIQVRSGHCYVITLSIIIISLNGLEC